MCEIPGIDPDKVERYGHRFLKLIRSAQRGYYEMKQQQENSTDDPPEDPNHRNVINISSEDEFADDCDLEDYAGEDDPQEERSNYFQATPDVDAFNARCEFAPCHLGGSRN
jgi:bloom syndrome protein